MNMENNDRFPLIPLDYSQRHLAVKKEIMFDYKECRLYVVDSKDKSIIYDITQRIINLVNSDISGDSLIVNISGVGRVNLTQYIEHLKSSMLKSSTFGGKIPCGSYAYDFKSITNHDGIIQLNNFWNGNTGQIPYIDDNKDIRWAYTDGVNPIVTINPGLDYIVRLSDRFNRTNVENGCIIDLIPIDRRYGIHNTIYWKVTSNATVKPNLRFASTLNVNLEYESDMKMNTSAIHIYKFETWDEGENWFESVKKYKAAANTFNDKVDLDYLLANYYTKEEVHDLIKWKDNNMRDLVE